MTSSALQPIATLCSQGFPLSIAGCGTLHLARPEQLGSLLVTSQAELLLHAGYDGPGRILPFIGELGRPWLLLLKPPPPPHRDAVYELFKRSDRPLQRITAPKPEPSSATPQEVVQALSQCLLVSPAPAITWSELSEQIRHAHPLRNDTRYRMCIQLWQDVLTMERQHNFHGALSSQNVLVDENSGDIQVVNWAELIAYGDGRTSDPTPRRPNQGYQPPHGMRIDPALGPDRVSAAVLTLEWLSMHTASPVAHDSPVTGRSLLPQSEIHRRKGPVLHAHRERLVPALRDLLNDTLRVDDTRDCPAPDAWLQVLEQHRHLPRPRISQARKEAENRRLLYVVAAVGAAIGIILLLLVITREASEIETGHDAASVPEPATMKATPLPSMVEERPRTSTPPPAGRAEVDAGVAEP